MLKCDLRKTTQELELNERIVLEKEHFVTMVPYWAVWPYEAMILPRKHYQDITQLNLEEEQAFVEIIKNLCIKYDNIFETTFPYSSLIHQQPTEGKTYPGWHFHMSFYPPLLGSKTIKKFMVGHELFASPQRNISDKQAAETIRDQSDIHYTNH